MSANNQLPPMGSPAWLNMDARDCGGPSELASATGYAACVAELFALSVEADETLRACKEQGDDEGRIEHRGRRDAYNHALEIVKRHNVKVSDPAL